MSRLTKVLFERGLNKKSKNYSIEEISAVLSSGDEIKWEDTQFLQNVIPSITNKYLRNLCRKIAAARLLDVDFSEIKYSGDESIVVDGCKNSNAIYSPILDLVVPEGLYTINTKNSWNGLFWAKDTKSNKKGLFRNNGHIWAPFIFDWIHFRTDSPKVETRYRNCYFDLIYLKDPAVTNDEKDSQLLSRMSAMPEGYTGSAIHSLGDGYVVIIKQAILKPYDDFEFNEDDIVKDQNAISEIFSQLSSEMEDCGSPKSR